LTDTSGRICCVCCLCIKKRPRRKTSGNCAKNRGEQIEKNSRKRGKQSTSKGKKVEGEEKGGEEGGQKMAEQKEKQDFFSFVCHHQ